MAPQTLMEPPPSGGPPPRPPPFSASIKMEPSPPVPLAWGVSEGLGGVETEWGGPGSSRGVPG